MGIKIWPCLWHLERFIRQKRKDSRDQRGKSVSNSDWSDAEQPANWPKKHRRRLHGERNAKDGRKNSARRQGAAKGAVLAGPAGQSVEKLRGDEASKAHGPRGIGLAMLKESIAVSAERSRADEG